MSALHPAGRLNSGAQREAEAEIFDPFVGKLGTDALAGMALVFPIVMLMQMTSAGAMGGSIASSIARALGAGRRRIQPVPNLGLH